MLTYLWSKELKLLPFLPWFWFQLFVVFAGLFQWVGHILPLAWFLGGMHLPTKQNIMISKTFFWHFPFPFSTLKIAISKMLGLAFFLLLSMYNLCYFQSPLLDFVKYWIEPQCLVCRRQDLQIDNQVFLTPVRKVWSGEYWVMSALTHISEKRGVFRRCFTRHGLQPQKALQWTPVRLRAQVLGQSPSHRCVCQHLSVNKVRRKGVPTCVMTPLNVFSSSNHLQLSLLEPDTIKHHD